MEHMAGALTFPSTLLQSPVQPKAQEATLFLKKNMAMAQEWRVKKGFWGDGSGMAQGWLKDGSRTQVQHEAIFFRMDQGFFFVFDPSLRHPSHHQQSHHLLAALPCAHLRHLKKDFQRKDVASSCTLRS